MTEIREKIREGCLNSSIDINHKTMQVEKQQGMKVSLVGNVITRTLFHPY